MSNQYQVIAIYLFASAEHADRAVEALWRSLSGGFEKSAGGEIWILQSCQDPTLAANICRAMGGNPK